MSFTTNQSASQDRSQSVRPVAPTIQPANIPRALTRLRQWVLWRYSLQHNKWTKVPYQTNSQRASTTDPTTWTDYKSTLAALNSRTFGHSSFDGLGFVLSKRDPFCGIDLDHCIENDKLSAWAQRVVDALDSYTEITPSGFGLRIFIRAKLHGGGRKNDRIEIYDDARFLTITGRVYEAHD